MIEFAIALTGVSLILLVVALIGRFYAIQQEARASKENISD